MKVADLKEGYQLIEDVKGLTKYPIIPKNTILTKETIEVLKVFFIEEVNVAEPVKRKRSPKKHPEALENEPNRTEEETRPQKHMFFLNYLKAVESYKNQFINWQSGIQVDINKIRKFLIPLLNALEENPIQLLLLQNHVKKQDYLYHHAVSVGLISGYIAKRLKLGKGDSIQVALAGCLSDCGMAKIDPVLLQKESLTETEKEEIKMHPQLSYKMVHQIPSLNQGAKLGILQHHERLDGSGYPLGEKGDHIHLYAKIIAISDVYHAVVCDRVYKEKVSPFQALEILNYEQFGQFDIKIMETFTNSISSFSLNEYVKLSTGQTAKIIYINNRYPTRPVVRIEGSGEIVSLEEKKDIFIEEIMK